MLRPEMKPADGTPSGGGKPKPKPKPESHSNPYVAVPGDFLSPAPATPQRPSTANPPADRPTYGPENPAPPNLGGPGPVYPSIISIPKPPSSSSSSDKKPDRDKEASDKPQIAVAADSAQPETTADISALDLAFGWSSEFGSRPMEVGSDDELVSAVAKSVRHEGLFEHYYDDLVGYLKNFAPYGWDAGADRQAEAYLQKYIEEMKLHYAGQAKREEWLELADSPSVTIWKQYAAKSGIERVLVLDANTQAMLHDQPGVVGDDGHQTAGLQDYVVDVLRQFETIYIHNHPNGTGASAADLQSAFDAGADMLIVVTEGGYEEVYIRGSLEMKLVRSGPASYEVDPLTTGEFVYQYSRSQRQARLEAVDPAEYVFHEDDLGIRVEVSGTLRIFDRETFDRDEDQPLRVYDFSETSKEYTIVGKLHSNSSVLLLEENNVFRFWVDQRDPDTVFQIPEDDLGRIPTIDERGQVIQAPEQVTAPAADQAQAQRAILEQQYGVLLDSHRVDESGNKVIWSEEAIASVLDAVEVTANALWSIRDQLDWYATPNDKAELFRTAFGSVKILLPDETSKYKAETVAAEQGPDGSWDNRYNVIKSYDPGWENRGDWFEFNLVHEFAHVLGNRVGGEFPGDRVVRLNNEHSYYPGFDDLGWGEASGPGWVEDRKRIWETRGPEVTRQAAPELDGPNEEWADMFLFWTYEQAGQVTFSSDYPGDARRLFMSRNMPRIINARYRILLSPEEMVELAEWDEFVELEEDLYLPSVTAREDNFAYAEIRQHLDDPVNLDPRHLNRDSTVVAGKLTDGELTTIFGRSHNLPYLLHKTANGEVGWTHMELFDLSEVNVEDLLLLPNDARETLIEPQVEE